MSLLPTYSMQDIPTYITTKLLCSIKNNDDDDDDATKTNNEKRAVVKICYAI